MYMYYFVGYELMMKEENPFSKTSSNESETPSIEERSIDSLSEKVKQKVSPADKYYIFCLFNLVFCSTQEFLHLYRSVTITSEGLQILIYTKHSWQLSSKGTLT